MQPATSALEREFVSCGRRARRRTWPKVRTIAGAMKLYTGF